jgi:hypothetical protein
VAAPVVDELLGCDAAFDGIWFSSAINILTNAYSMSEANTNKVHDDMNISIALIYETGGNDFCD